MNAGLDLMKAVQLPPGEDMNEWLAVHGKKKEKENEIEKKRKEEK